MLNCLHQTHSVPKEICNIKYRVWLARQRPHKITFIFCFTFAFGNSLSCGLVIVNYLPMCKSGIADPLPSHYIWACMGEGKGQ